MKDQVTSMDAMRNIGIMAHVDAGKTTLTEQLLYVSGAIAAPGRVDHGTSHTDSMDVERERGITVRSASACLRWKGASIQIIDTPGHADFYPEVERSIQVLDGVILVVSSVEGIQLQTLTIWSALREMRIPTIIFINKLDRLGASPGKLLGEMREQLSVNVLSMQMVNRLDKEVPGLEPARDSENQMADIIECLASLDDGIMSKFIQDEQPSWGELNEAIKRLSLAGQVFPVFYGVAKTGLGVAELLDAIVDYLPPPEGNSDNDLSALIYKVENSGSEGRTTFVRVFEGMIAQKQTVLNATIDEYEKVNRILKLNNGVEYVDVSHLMSGETGALFGLKKSRIGDVLGHSYAVPELPSHSEPMFTARISPTKANDWNELLEALQQLEDEDPLLQVEWLEDQREINIRFFGAVQQEIIRNMLASRFQVEAEFSKPSIIYKETPAAEAEASLEFRTFGFADITIRITPLPRGSGFQYVSLLSGDNKIYQKFLKQIPMILKQCLLHGLKGWEVTDFKVTLVDGYCRYDLGTKPGDFKIAVPIVFKQALEKAGTKLLEPMMEFHIRIPEEYGAQIYRDLVKMRAKIEQPLTVENTLEFMGQVPVSEIFEYTSAFSASSHGRGVIKTKFCGYYPMEQH